MIQSRLKRVQEKRLTQRIFIFLGLSAAIILFLVFFGLKILIGFSIFVDNLRGKPSQVDTISEFISPPVLSPLPEATNSARIVIQGYGDNGLDVTLYDGENEEETVTVNEEGTFTFRNLILDDGKHTFTAVQTDKDGNRSAPSDALTITIITSEPKLELVSPETDATIRGEENMELPIEGSTDEGNRITVNGRIVVVSSNGSFSTRYRLNEGENQLTIAAIDPAGNTISIERIIKYEK